jgi:hypothetical protein
MICVLRSATPRCYRHMFNELFGVHHMDLTLFLLSITCFKSKMESATTIFSLVRSVLLACGARCLLLSRYVSVAIHLRR